MSRLLLIVILVFLCRPVVVAQTFYSKRQTEGLPKQIQKAYRKTDKFLKAAINGDFQYIPPERTRIDSVLFRGDTLEVRFKDEFAYKPLRAPQVRELRSHLLRALGGIARHHPVTITVKGYPLSELVPNLYREIPDPGRLAGQNSKPGIHVQNISKPYAVSAGLNTRHIALWNSHGWYYDNKLDRWEWQRSTNFTTVEDVLPTSFVLPFLVPMLENAGADVYLPRERDIQTNEVIVDNSDPTYCEETPENTFSTSPGSGYGHAALPYQSGQNPFKEGNYRILKLKPGSQAKVAWTPVIPEKGEYAVYVSYQTRPDSWDKAHYEVKHAGGSTHFIVNQRMGGGTWVYLGKFRFNAGEDPEHGSVILFANGAEGQVLTADAVRFGGGNGNIARNGKISGRPRWTEGARYYLQYCGFPDTLVYNQNADRNDYVDDYRSRGRWVNYMLGGKYMEPWITKGKEVPGLHIPIDLSLAFHTDAGHYPGTDTIVGTLAIYSTRDARFNQKFPDGKDRLVNRDFADVLSTQIVNDIRAEIQPAWPQRELWDRRYSEATYPTVPSALLELLSHQNLGDMIYGNDPEFRFVVARAIYKGMLKFMAGYHQIPFVVQPLPVKGLLVTLENGRAKLSWEPVEDPVEPSAKAKQFVVYTRPGDGGWDNGTLTSQPVYTTPVLHAGKIYSFKVAAVNEGGESFPSAVMSVCKMNNGKPPVLVIDAFDRVSAPKLIKEGNFAGFAGWLDEGVAWGNDLSTIGSEYNFDQTSPWKDDDDPGHGASYDNRAGMAPLGNNFDHIYSHGEAIKNAGHGFVSASRKAVEEGKISLSEYRLVDLAFGEEKTTVRPGGVVNYPLFTPALQQVLENFLTQKDKGLFISGSYIGSDAFINKDRKVDDSEKEFIKKMLGYRGRASHASMIPLVKATTGSPLVAFDGSFGYNTKYRKDMYRVESADAIIPANDTATMILRYVGNNKGAGVAFSKDTRRIMTFGFPFETITSREQRNKVMKQVLDYLQNK